MALAIRDVKSQDQDAVLALNNGAGSAILPMDSARFELFMREACYFRVAEIDGHLAGFLVALRENADYASSNFRWFRDRYPHFVYIDRIVIASTYRGHGLGRIFYCDTQSYAEVRVPLLACEVFLEPRDDATMLFHGTYGFHEVGQQRLPEIDRHVCLLAKQLPSFQFVEEHYLDEHGHLPDLAWLKERSQATGQPRQRAAGNT